ncbi:tetratricopeptide repeat protein [Aeromonas veronii]|uniref:tetratricopeptide repeat protein n=1 Tax=Aeromonas veronii TaxID=654 RepID=UPI001115FB19|nr:SEL1-like repeat protein [Aeromonas veronii]TNI56335.1 hypothetical protein CF125_08735 [Aeromonas veronii]
MDKSEIAALIKAAKSGDATAQFQLGELYDFGKKIEQSDSQAFLWYRKAAEQGYPSAQWRCCPNQAASHDFPSPR